MKRNIATVLLFVFSFTHHSLVDTLKAQVSGATSSKSFITWLAEPTPLISAHRGGPYSGYPENALETFEFVATQIRDLIIECDVALTKDSVMVLMHDRTLDRTTTGSGAVEDFTFEEISSLYLIDNDGDTTDFRIPTLLDVLRWGKGKVLFTLDIKRSVPFSLVISMIEELDAADYAAIITYSLDDATFIHKQNANLILSVSLQDSSAIQQFKKMNISADKTLAFVGTREPDINHYASLQKLGIPTILGTLGNLDRSAVARANDAVYSEYIQRGATIIATDRPLEVAKVLIIN